MSLSSQLFLFYFLPLVLLAHALVPRRGRNLLLTLASYVFYAWANPLWILLILATTTVDYCCGLVIAGPGSRRGEAGPQLESGGPRSRAQRGALLVSLIADLSLLGFFKYTGFAVTNLQALLGALGLDGPHLAPPSRWSCPSASASTPSSR